MTTGTTKAVDRFVQVGGLNLHYLEWGEAGAPPVIMVHGLSGNAHAFDNLAPHFVPRYHVISVDVRGRGDSDWASRTPTTPTTPTSLTWKGCDRPWDSSECRWSAPPWVAVSP